MSAEKLAFKTELKQLLDLITHSLYSHKEVFLRELISNACDAIDKLQFNSVNHEELLEGDSDWKIKITPDSAAGTLTVSDNGIGMDRETIVRELGTIARSGTLEFLDNLRKSEAGDRPELIGQFGVGFYASFMVADKVTVISRAAGETQAVRWESDGQGEFSVEEADKPTRGTDVILHLREGEKEFLEPWTIRPIVTKFSDFVEHPVVMDVEKEEDGEKKTVEETLNKRKAIWLRSKSDITEAEYEEFYRHLSHDVGKPAKTIHYVAEGANEFRVLLFIPGQKPFDMTFGEQKPKLHLYVRRVFIMDDCEKLLPTYLRFVRGVVDSSDLPLNVSREMLQQNPILDNIRKNIIGKVLKTLADMQENEYEAYVKFHGELGAILKEGVSEDFSNRERIAELLLFESSKTAAGEYTSLDKYVEAMPEGQEEIYYLIGESRELLAASPYLEAFKARGHEVLLMTDPIDEFWVSSLPEFKGKKLRSVDKGELPSSDEDKEKHKEVEQKFAVLLAYLKGRLEDDVKEVRLSHRLTDSAACLVADEHAMGAHMERLMERIGRGESIPQSKRILELNPEHRAVTAMYALYAEDPKDPRVEDYARILYDQAVIAEGSKVQDPLAFARRVNNLLVKDADQSKSRA